MSKETVFKKGVIVKDISRDKLGIGIVDHIDKSRLYPIGIKYANGAIVTYGYDGKRYEANTRPSIIKVRDHVWEVGQRVFSARYGWGAVDKFLNDDAYPLVIYFNVEMNYKVKYKLDGLEDYNDKYPTLSFTNYIIDRFSQDPKDATYEQIEPDFDWGCLPAWANKYIAKDRDGSWCAYNEEPIKDVIDGMFDGSNYVDIPRKFKPTNGDDIEWENSILKNPNHD